MKIVLIGTAYPLRGGIAHYVGLLWKYLSRSHDVRIVTFSRQYPKLLFPGKSQDESGDAGIPVESVQWIDSINPFNWIRTGFRVRALQPDLIVFKFWMPFFAPSYGTIAAIARWGRKTKSMFICDNIIPHERRPGDKLLTRFAFRFIDSYVVQSRAVERDLKLWHRDPLLSYLPHPVYEIFGDEQTRGEAREQLRRVDASMDLAADDRVLLFFGYVRDYKGLDVILDAMPAILERMKVKLLVVGEFYNNEQHYREQVARLGIGNYVLFHSDYVPNEEVGVFFSAADVMTLPYKSATQSGIIQIAYNFHRPVIATDVGGLGEVVITGRTGTMVPPERPHALAEAVVEYFEKDCFEDYRANVIEERKKYSWEHMAEGIEQLYERSLTNERS
ncbi:MAG: glycosyl transferase family 1 [Ignavibacteria bacterium]|nr:MAG: glycosyl transferase family 1 [Ignavibacteria bacterium]